MGASRAREFELETVEWDAEGAGLQGGCEGVDGGVIAGDCAVDTLGGDDDGAP